MRMTILRTNETLHQTIGLGVIHDESGQICFTFKTLELPFLQNKKGISCIPLGTYKCIKRKSERYGSHYLVTDVENRSMILIHVGNYHRNTSGCILVGKEHKYLDKDSELDVTNSLATMNEILQIMPNKFTLKVVQA